MVLEVVELDRAVIAMTLRHTTSEWPGATKAFSPLCASFVPVTNRVG
jgi:hypothetical protein